jgi:ribosome biogenesis GTPase
LIDSPGIRSFGVEDLLEEDLITYFPDIEAGAVNCKFSNCEHRADSKGCFFHSTFEQSSRENQLIVSRLESFTRMKEEISSTPSYLKKS